MTSAFIRRRVEQLQEPGQGRGLDLDQPEPRRDPGRGRVRKEGANEIEVERGHQGQERETNSKVSTKFDHLPDCRYDGTTS